MFNGVVSFDLMWLKLNDTKKKKVPILQIIDTHSHFQSALFLKGESARDIWDAFIEAWSTVYVGYPRTLKADHGSVFTSKNWKEWSAMAGINLEISGVESHNSNGLIERYHDPLRKIYNCIREDYPKLDPESVLRCAIKGINDTMGPEGIVPSYLVFGVLPSFPPLNTTLPHQKDIMAALNLSRNEMASMPARLRIQQALRSSLPPATLYNIDPGEKVYVFREKQKDWKGPYEVDAICGKQVYLSVDGHTKQFNISQILPDRDDVHEHELSQFKEGLHQFLNQDQPPGIFLTEVLEPGDKRANQPEFKGAKMKEIEGQIERGAFEIVLKDELPENANILGSRFVLSIKENRTNKEVFKTRYVVQGDKDTEKNLLVYTSSNIKHTSLRLLLCLASLFGFNIWSQDVSQAYIQSAQKLLRDIYIKPAKEFHLSKDTLLKLLKPLYGLCDSGDYWYSTITNFITDDMHMQPKLSDAALFFKLTNGSISGLLGTYVDDAISTGTPNFDRESKRMEK